MPIGTPIIKQKKTDIITDDKVIIACVQILHAAIKSKSKADTIANLIPTDTHDKMINADITYHQGIKVKYVSSGLIK